MIDNEHKQITYRGIVGKFTNDHDCFHSPHIIHAAFLATEAVFNRVYRKPRILNMLSFKFPNSFINSCRNGVLE